MSTINNRDVWSSCVCCGNPIPSENSSMLCNFCIEKISAAQRNTYPAPPKNNSRLFRREFKKVRKAIVRAACSGKRYVRIYVSTNVVEEILERLIADGYKATQSGYCYDSPLFILW